VPLSSLVLDGQRAQSQEVVTPGETWKATTTSQQQHRQKEKAALDGARLQRLGQERFVRSSSMWEGDVTAICTHHIHPCPSSEVRARPAHPRGRIESGDWFSCSEKEVPAAAQMTRAQVTTLADLEESRQRADRAGGGFFGCRTNS
jgi:hypothetical protein